MNRREQGVLLLCTLWVIALSLVVGCAHNSGKPYTALDYAKVSINQLNNSFQLAVALVPEMKKFPDPKVQAAYPKALDILEQAGMAIKTYGQAIRLWEVSGVRPTNITALKQSAQKLIDDVTDMLIFYKVIK